MACLAGLLLVNCGAPALAPHEHEVLVRSYVFGAFGAKSVDVRDLCGGSAAERVDLTRRLSDYLAGAVTLGLYVPHRVRVLCAERR